ncbi:MAG: toxic anion resistance protein [Candidatus Eisenbacteria bacterium]|uniref:Toxic anion resistance protein n=1 Tax=Eiseniibacteriota bacterium TaxID=2212470 RepID=A0A956NIG8_UNCEI|nr:toxic anion resistance protein [Candidatus Eisenbacteria bacterium]
MTERDPSDLSAFTPEEQQRIEEIVAQIDEKDTQGVVTFGIGAQRQISDFADQILNEVRAKDAGYVGDVLTDLVVKVKELDVSELGAGESFLAKLPIVGSFVDSVKKFIARYDKLSVEIEKIIDELGKARMGLLKDITLLDGMFDRNVEFLKDLDLFIAAGTKKLVQLRSTTLPELEKKAAESDDPLDAQRLQDFNQFLTRFERKIHDLRLSRMVSIQTAPQIRLIQNGNQALVEKIQSSVLSTIPLWKNQIVIALTIYRQQKAVNLQREISDTTNELLEKNAEMLKKSGVELAKETERGIIDIETLRKVNQELITTIEETLQIQKAGREQRRMAETELVKLEGELKDKLKSIEAR